MRDQGGTIFGFQYPAEIPGVSNANFLRAAGKLDYLRVKKLTLLLFKRNLF